MDKYKQALDLIKTLEIPTEWKPMFDREIQFLDKLIECLEERDKVSRAING